MESLEKATGSSPLRRLLSWLLGSVGAALLFVGCAHSTEHFYLPGFASDQYYATKVDLTAIVIRDGATGKATDVEFSGISGSQSAGTPETVPAGTKIKVEKVVRQYDIDQGTLVRVSAKVDSGIYRGAIANLSKLSVTVKGSDGKQSDLVPNQDYLLKVEE